MKNKDLKPSQLRLYKKDLRFFGGMLLHKKRRSHRPLNCKEAIHLVMRSSWAMGATSFLRPRNKTEIQNLIRTLAKKYEVRVYQKAIASNHIHLVIKIQSIALYRAFIRGLSGQIARSVMQKQSFKVFRRGIVRERGDGGPAKKEVQGLGQQFWQFRPWTRLLSWGKDYRGCCRYVGRNTLEALGFIIYQPRGKNPYLRWAALCGPWAESVRAMQVGSWGLAGLQPMPSPAKAIRSRCALSASKLWQSVLRCGTMKP